MANRNRLALKAANRRVLVAAFLVFGLLGGAAAFAVGYAGAVARSAGDPQATANLRAAALERIDADLGYEGYLRAYRAFYETGNSNAAADLRRLAGEADAGVTAFLRASGSESERAGAETLRRLLAPFRRAALFSAANGAAAANLPPPAALERDYAALKAEIAKTSAFNAAGRLRILSEALVWSQAASVAVLSLLSAVLFALAWFLRDRLIEPLENLRRSVAGAAQGNAALPIWGAERGDEIGAIARAAEMLRQSTMPKAKDPEPSQITRMVERLNRSVVKLEADLAQMASIASHARARIEDSSLRAAKASQSAAQAASLACEGTARMTEKTERMMLAANADARAAAMSLAETLARLTGIVAFIERGASVPQKPEAPQDEKNSHEPRELDAAGVLDDLVENLEALENYAHSRKDIRGEDAILLNAGLIDAIGRLNAVAGRVSAAAGTKAFRPS